MSGMEMGARRVTQIVDRTRGIQFWIDGRIKAGWTDEQIEAVLPYAVKFIAGDMSEADLRADLARRREEMS